MSADLPGALPGLARLRAMSGSRTRPSAERCELCAAEIPAEHGHVVCAAQRELLCVCRPCYLLFAQEGSAAGRFRAVPDRYVEIDGLPIDRVWDALQVPVGMAFFLRVSSRDRVVALYPSPAGPTESELPLDAWADVTAAAPALSGLTPDVEALLVRRPTAAPGGTSGAQIFRTVAYIVPVDVCYGLIGRLRREWRGFQGGDQAWRAVDETFAHVAARARGGAGV